jgi:hypothetical protein
MAVAMASIVGFAGACSGGAATPDHPTGTSGGVSTPGERITKASTPPPKPAEAPISDTCRRLDYAAISRYSNADDPVPCRAPHTAYTFAVRMIPAEVSVPGASIGNRSIQDAASTGCRNAFAGFIGGTPAIRALSRLSVTYFLPEQRDFNLGAHWVRCDVVALKTSNQLAALPQPLKGLLDKPDALTSYGLCSDGDPGASTSRLVMCAEPHTYRAKTALRLGSDDTRYPGVSTVGPGGQTQCKAYLTHLLDTTGGFTFGWTYPTAADWASGQRFGYCYLKTAK